MTDEQLFQFAQVNAQVLGLPTDEARLLRVVSHLKRTEAMAQLLDQVDYPADLEIAEIYCPNQIAA